MNDDDKVMHNFTDKVMRKGEGCSPRRCSACPYRLWKGDYALYICEISGKVIEPYYYCDVPREVIKAYIGEICKPKMKIKEN